MSRYGSFEGAPEPGEVWAGGGMTVRVVAVWPDGVTIVRLTGRGGLLKRPSGRAFIPSRAFVDGTMKRTALALNGGRE